MGAERHRARERRRHRVQYMEGSFVALVAKVHFELSVPDIEQLRPDAAAPPALEVFDSDSLSQPRGVRHQRALAILSQLADRETAEIKVVAEEQPHFAREDLQALGEAEVAQSLVVLTPEGRHRRRAD